MRLDLTIEAIRRKHQHIRAAGTANESNPYETPAAYVGQPLLECPARDSNVIRSVAEGDTYVVKEMLSGFNPREIFYRLTCTTAVGEPFWGYVGRIKAQPLDELQSDAQISQVENVNVPSGDPMHNAN